MNRRARLVSLVLTVAVLGAACGSDDNATTDTTAADPSVVATEPAPPETTEPAATEPAATQPAATEPAAPATTQPPAATQPPATEPTFFSAGDASDFFFDVAIAACNEQSERELGMAAFDGSADDPTIGVTFDQEVAPGVFQIEDSRGIGLLVDLNNRVVTGLDGPTGIMPRDYLFVCPESLFPGQFDEEAGPGAEEFFQESLAKCNEFSLGEDGSGFEPFDGGADDPTVGIVFDNEIGPDEYRIVDANGVVLVVDTNGGVVTGEDGPDGVMPRPYSFWCPPELFVGTLDE